MKELDERIEESSRQVEALDLSNIEPPLSSSQTEKVEEHKAIVEPSIEANIVEADISKSN